MIRVEERNRSNVTSSIKSYTMGGQAWDGRIMRCPRWCSTSWCTAIDGRVMDSMDGTVLIRRSYRVYAHHVYAYHGIMDSIMEHHGHRSPCHGVREALVDMNDYAGQRHGLVLRVSRIVHRVN